MAGRKSFRKAFRALRKFLRVLAKPVRLDRGRGGTVIQPYRGYGSRAEVFLIGRVFRQPGAGSGSRRDTLLGDLIDVGRRFLRWGVANAVVTARFGDAQQQFKTDRDGYFRVHMHPASLPSSEMPWYPMDLELAEPADTATTTRAEIFILPDRARCVVISDIDDTVMYTGVASKAKMLWRLFVEDAQSRVAFPGVAAFYRALHYGPSGSEHNPMLYVSRGPWSIYEVLDEFFNWHQIPIGPILFLREWGLTLQRPFPPRAKGHKRQLLERMLVLYEELPFVLIGDSGQRDPEIYTKLVQEYPSRVRAIYIRNVSRSADRVRAIEALAKQVTAAGSHLVLAADSFAMAEHAAQHGLISPAALAQVLAEREAEQGPHERQTTRQIDQQTIRETPEAVGRGELAEALEENTGQETPPNIVVESEERDKAQSQQGGAPNP